MKQSIAIFSQKHNNSGSENGSPLVRLPNCRPTSNDAACSGSAKKSEIDNDGVVSVEPGTTERRFKRYERQSASRQLLPKKRVVKCLRWKIASTVKVLKSVEHGKCHYGDLVVCGSIWDCPVCAGKITPRRQTELSCAISQHTDQGGSVLLVTLTTPHQREDDLKDLLTRQQKAMTWFYGHRTYKEFKKRYMKRGRVRALEVNHGEANGWHPHVHELWFLNLNLHDYSVLKQEVYDLWVKACAKYGLGEPSWEHGVDIRGGEQAAKYVAKFGEEENKWGLADELTKANVKKGRNGSRSPFQLLDDYIEGDKRAGALFIEYSNAFFRKQQLTWSKGLKAQFELDEKTDDDLAHEQEDAAILLAEIEPEQWDIIRRTSNPKHDNRAIVLVLAENGGADVMHQFITDLVARYKQTH